ncbi:hypothetical protein QI222_03980 [Staphylococcus saprophyticus]|uniref:hypothetical protein n=1 Tax=Staphylococcus saprophyticus TaxID=29385 RepID=UPI0011A74BB6|nr:hypothetical protein [Staphylococcus saprophyticus]MDW4104094.1 hypothetical protein [Staphylococcus saprophyticus]MDW4205180.1 hypothetical protein [Staphylococcus saprophyticus]
MIKKVWNEHKTLEIGTNGVKYIEFFKHETGNIDMYLGKDENNNTRAIEGYFIGKYDIEYNHELTKVEVDKQKEVEQLDLFNFM